MPREIEFYLGNGRHVKVMRLPGGNTGYGLADMTPLFDVIIDGKRVNREPEYCGAVWNSEIVERAIKERYCDVR